MWFEGWNNACLEHTADGIWFEAYPRFLVRVLLLPQSLLAVHAACAVQSCWFHGAPYGHNQMSDILFRISRLCTQLTLATR